MGLIGFLVVAAAGAAAGGGTFATFTASTDNRSGAAAFDASNDMILGNTVVTPGSNTQCQSDGGGVFAESELDPAVADAVRCEVLFTATQVTNLALGTTITSDIILENESADSKTGILRWAAVDEDYVGCVDSTGVAFGSSSVDLCENIALTIQEYAASGSRDTVITPRETDFADLTPLGADANGGTRCTFPRVSTLCSATTATNQLASLLPTSFHATNSVIDNNMEPTNTANNSGVRFFRITAKLVGDTICTVTNDADSNGIIDATGVGCSNGADGTAKFTLRWVLQETA